MTSSSISPENAEFYELFSRCNHTELYQIARRNGFVVFPNLSPDALIRIIIGEEEPPPIQHDIDAWRLGIMRFLLDHRRRLETQLSCPAKQLYVGPPAESNAAREEVAQTVRGKGGACFGCIDTQVVHCLTSNGPENFKLIELHKKRTP